VETDVASQKQIPVSWLGSTRKRERGGSDGPAHSKLGSALAARAALAILRVDRLAGATVVPYLLWTGFATYLNAGLIRKNIRL
jgi:hypothetical protein